MAENKTLIYHPLVHRDLVNMKEVIKLNMTVEEGIKMIISAGMLTPTEKQKKLSLLKKR